jgi:hypothetical protein
MAQRTTVANHEATMKYYFPGCKTAEEREWSSLLDAIRLAYQINAHLDGVHGRPVREWKPFNVPSQDDIAMGRRMGAKLMSASEEM